MNAETFNALYPIGTPVFAYPGARPEDIPSARRIVTRTRTKAQPVGLDREGVVWVEDHGAYIALTHVDVAEEAEWKAAQTADTVRELGALPMPAGPVLRNSSVIPLPSNWSCAYGVSDDEPFCTDDGEEHVCPTIRVHRDDAEQFAALVARVHELEAELHALKVSRAPRLCVCGHSIHAHTVPAPHSCFAYGQTCPCPQYRQLLPDEAVAQLERTRQAAAERAREDEEPAR